MSFARFRKYPYTESDKNLGSSSGSVSLLTLPSQFPSDIIRLLHITAAGPRRTYTDFSIKYNDKLCRLHPNSTIFSLYTYNDNYIESLCFCQSFDTFLSKCFTYLNCNNSYLKNKTSKATI